MGEGGGGINATINVNDLYTSVRDDIGGWFSSEATTNLADNVFVLPRGINSPNELTGWSNDMHHMWDSVKWTGTLSDTRIKLGVYWYFNGSHQGQGRYIANADIYFVINEIGSFEKFEVTGTFDPPLGDDNGVARLEGQLRAKYYEWGSLSWTGLWRMQIRGDGAGSFNRIS